MSASDQVSVPAVAPNCDNCKKPMDFVYAIPRVMESGSVRLFRCEHCDKMKFID